jgi:hypothetical protein
MRVFLGLNLDAPAVEVTAHTVAVAGHVDYVGGEDRADGHLVLRQRTNTQELVRVLRER